MKILIAPIKIKLGVGFDCYAKCTVRCNQLGWPKM